MKLITIHTGGQPDAAEFAKLAQSGVKHIVNLRPDAEMPDMNEAAIVQQQGMQYHHLPISGAADLTREKVEQFDLLMQQIADEPVLVHCASGNRVGALAALRAGWLEGQSIEQALATGRAWGLTRLEPVVEELLQQ